MNKILLLGTVGWLGLSPTLALADSANATANAPVYTPGSQMLSQDLSGNLRVTPVGGSGVASLTPIAGTNGTSVASSSNPVPVYTALPVTASAFSGLTMAQTTVAAASLVLKSTGGLLYSVTISNASVAGFLILFNSTVKPGDGTVSPMECLVVPATTATTSIVYAVPEFYSTGITAVFSTGATCFAQVTTSGTAFIHGAVK